VPDAQTQEMRNLLRTRKQLVREQSSHVLRVQKHDEDFLVVRTVEEADASALRAKPTGPKLVRARRVHPPVS
jgi:transposase